MKKVSVVQPKLVLVRTVNVMMDIDVVRNATVITRNVAKPKVVLVKIVNVAQIRNAPKVVTAIIVKNNVVQQKVVTVDSIVVAMRKRNVPKVVTVNNYEKKNSRKQTRNS